MIKRQIYASYKVQYRSLDTLDYYWHHMPIWAWLQEKEKRQMGSASAAMKKRQSEGGALLKGSSIPPKQRNITIQVEQAREAPDNFGAPIILDIEEKFGCQSFACNKTNTKLLAEQLGDDLDDWAGARIVLTKCLVRNPKTGQMVDSLIVDSVISPSKAQNKAAKKRAVQTPRTDDDVPF